MMSLFIVAAIASSAVAAESCKALFVISVPDKVLSVSQIFAEKIKKAFSRSSIKMESTPHVSERELKIEKKFNEIFSDVPPEFLENIQIVVDENADPDSPAGAREGGKIYVHKNLLDSPLWPVVKAHEMQHIIDQRNNLLRTIDSPFSPVPDFHPLDSLHSEIRAFIREYNAINILYSRSDLQQLRETVSKSEFSVSLLPTVDQILNGQSQRDCVHNGILERHYGTLLMAASMQGLTALEIRESSTKGLVVPKAVSLLKQILTEYFP